MDKSPNTRTGHTPGPWRIEISHPQNACAYVQSETGHEVALCFGGDEVARGNDGIWPKQPIRDANARLVAAAPELLVALQRAAHLLAELPECRDIRVLGVRQMAVAAISKAAPEYYGLPVEVSA